VSIADALRKVIANHPDHQLKDTKLSRHASLLDPRVTQLGTFVCTRGYRYRFSIHWTGTRYWTVHEAMLLQGAPAHYRLAGTITQKMRQIGNAFPSVAAEQIYRKCIESLRRTDAADERLNRRERAGMDESPSVRRMARQTDEALVSSMDLLNSSPMVGDSPARAIIVEDRRPTTTILDDFFDPVEATMIDDTDDGECVGATTLDDSEEDYVIVRH
jgi:hypothetical protein